MDLKEMAAIKSGLASGHRTCAGCGIPPIVRTVLRSVKGPKIIVNATGCLEVCTTIYPFSSWEDPYIHSVFGNAGATASGIEAAIKYLQRQNRLSPEETPKIVVFGGDGGTYDIGLQSLSGAIERGHDFLYVCYDNEAYMNTGVQRSSATPHYAATTTTPTGRYSQGKVEVRKPLMEIIIAHRVPYAAQASVSHLLDLSNKVQKAVSIRGPKFINVLQPCPVGWKFPSSQTNNIAKLGVESRFWPLYEVVRVKDIARWSLTVQVPKAKPIREFLQPQGRFKHLFRNEEQNEVKEIQAEIDRRWQELMLKVE